MPKTIWKERLEITDRQTVNIPCGAQLLTVQMQYGAPCLWFLCDSDAPNEKVNLAIYGTGHRVQEQLDHTYIGTFQADGALVFHVFKIGE